MLRMVQWHLNHICALLLLVTQELDNWEDESLRQRKWFTLDEAEEALKWKPMQMLMFNNLKERLGLLPEPKELEKKKSEEPLDTSESKHHQFN